MSWYAYLRINMLRVSEIDLLKVDSVCDNRYLDIEARYYKCRE
jgi:hypothetical protein